MWIRNLTIITQQMKINQIRKMKNLETIRMKATVNKRRNKNCKNNPTSLEKSLK